MENAAAQASILISQLTQNKKHETLKKGNKMRKKLILLAFMLGIILSNLSSQESQEQKFFQRHLNHRVYLGFYSSYFDDNIKLLQGGYDALLGLINITPTYDNNPALNTVGIVTGIQF
jgi:hypothetical protein